MRVTTLALAAIGIAVPFAAANAQQAPQSYNQGPPPGYQQGPPPGYDQNAQPGYDQGQKHQFRHLLSKEQRAVLHEQIASQANGGKKQVKEAFRQQMEQIASMSPDQQAQTRNQLQAQWDALPAGEKQQLEQQMAEHREHHQERRQGQQSGAQQQGPQGQAPQYSNDGDDDE